MSRPQHLVFDVNETLLDLSPLDSVFETIFGDARFRGLWFARLLHWSTITTLTGQFKDFGALASDCLESLAADQGIALSTDHRQQVFDTIATLPPHPEVRDALEKLKNQGYALTALTNSAQKTVDTQFANAGLTPLFDHVLSVDAARCYKPHPDAYAVATQALSRPAADLRLIACHDWDITGAQRAGMQAAYVARDGKTINPAGDTPDIIGSDLGDVADQIVQQG